MNRYTRQHGSRRRADASGLVSLIVAAVALGVVAVTFAMGAPVALGGLPNDPSFPWQWAYSNTGQSIPTQALPE